jgi:hypothetical protein
MRWRSRACVTVSRAWHDLRQHSIVVGMSASGSSCLLTSTQVLRLLPFHDQRPGGTSQLGNTAIEQRDASPNVGIIIRLIRSKSCTKSVRHDTRAIFKHVCSYLCVLQGPITHRYQIRRQARNQWVLRLSLSNSSPPSPTWVLTGNPSQDVRLLACLWPMPDAA